MAARILCANVLALLSLFAFTAASSGQTFPDRVVRIANPFPPGGSGDVMASLLAQKLTDELGQQVIVENRSGAGGNTGAESVAKSEHDGHTLLVTAPGPLVVHPTTSPKGLAVDPAKDFAPIALFATTPLVLMVNNQVPAKNVAELIALAKQKPGQINFASAGIGPEPPQSREVFTNMDDERRGPLA